MDMLLQRLAELNSAILPGGRVPFLLGVEQVGWLGPALAEAVAGFDRVQAGPAGVVLDDPAALPGIARALSERGLLRWRREAFDVRAAPDGPVLSTIDRGALPAFGIEAQGIHLDALVRRPDGLHIWIGKRAATKALDPGKLDHIVAGGMPAGHGPQETLVKEAEEEAAMPAELARRAVRTGVLRYAMERPEGLRRDLLHCYEVELPEDFTPTPRDGEVEGFALWPLPRVAEALREGGADFKFNVVAVLAALLLRHGLFAGAEAARIRAALPGYIV
jgi:8-oxo-dGTP pyrophosphatase MutT (NUDIX family)